MAASNKIPFTKSSPFSAEPTGPIPPVGLSESNVSSLVQVNMSLSVFKWNIEGFSRNIHNLKYFTDLHSPSLIFLSEPMLFLHNAQLLLNTFSGQYSSYLNSDNRHIPEIAINDFRAKGGTMAMWEAELDPYVSIHPTASSSILALILAIPNYQKSIHLGIYLPTSGKSIFY